MPFAPVLRGECGAPSASDVARRLKGAGDAHHALERALDWLADGVALVRADGAVVYVNEAFQAITRRDDGVALRKGALEFAAAEARAKFEAAIGATFRLHGSGVQTLGSGDFPIARSSSTPAYLASVRPLFDRTRSGRAGARALAIVLIRDPLGRNTAAGAMMRGIFGFTESEANLAQALLAGTPLSDYARARAVSLNTVYTHLRRIREKTGCSRMAELIRKLNDLQVPLRLC
jgi:DNA-binding CsgD family transcriptional regulator